MSGPICCFKISGIHDRHSAWGQLPQEIVVKLDIRDDQGDPQRCWSPVAWNHNVTGAVSRKSVEPFGTGPEVFNDMVQSYFQQAALDLKSLKSWQFSLHLAFIILPGPRIPSLSGANFPELI